MTVANITERVVLIRLSLIKENLNPVQLRENLAGWNDVQRTTTTPDELYDITRGIWKIGERREKVGYAFAVIKGVIKEVYKIEQWYPSLTTEYKTRTLPNPLPEKYEGRFEFTGKISDEMHKKYVGKSVSHYFKRGDQHPTKCLNIS
ncbi:MAG: hypothetical protein QX189_17310 [Methylococcales bacterium]